MTDGPPPREPSRLPRWVPAAALALLVALPLLPALLPGQTVFFRDLGLAPGPILEQAFSGGEWLPLWTSSLGEGRPLLANPGNSLLAPLSLLYRLLPFELAFELFLMLHLVIAALGMARLAKALGASEPASWLAGAAFGLGGFMISSTNLAPTLAAAAFAPWVALAGLRAVDAPSAWRLACLALALAACALGGQPEPVILTIVASSAWAFLAATGSLRSRVGRSLLAWGVGGIWALLISAPQVLVAGLHARVSLRSFGFTTEGLLYNSLHPERLPAFFLPGWGGHPLERLSGGFPHGLLEDTGSPYLLTLYLGLSVLLLALAAVLRPGTESRLTRLRPALALTALAGLVLAIGRHLPGLSAAVEAAPLLQPFRYPIKFAFLAHLAMPLLAAAGLDALRARVPDPRRRLLGLGLPLLVACDLLLAHASFVPTISKDEGWTRTPLAVALHQNAAARGIEPGQWRLYVHRLRSPWGPSLPNDRLDEVELYRRQRRLLLPAMGLPQGIDYAFDPSFDLLDPLEEFELARATHAEPGPRQWRAVGIASALFVISPEPGLEASSQGALRRLGPIGASWGLTEGDAWLYDNTAFRPRVRLDSAALLGDGVSVADLMTRLSQGDAAEVQATGTGAVTIEHEDHRSLRVHASSKTPATLVVSDTLTEGWSARLDGEPVPLLRANAVFRAIELPAGEHLVEMRYRPPGLLPGTVLASVGLLCVGGAFLRDRRK